MNPRNDELTTLVGTKCSKGRSGERLEKGRSKINCQRKVV